MGSEYGPNASITGSLAVDGDIDLGSGDDDVDLDSGTLFVDAGNNRVGIGTDSPGVTLELEAVAGDIFKMENATAYGLTYGQLVKENLSQMVILL